MGFRIADAGICALDNLQEALLIVLPRVGLDLGQDQSRTIKRKCFADQCGAVGLQLRTISDQIHYRDDRIQNSMTNAADAANALSALRRAVQNPTKRQILAMVEDSAGRFLRPPEPELSTLVEFQIMHTRTLIAAPDIFLAHFFVDLVTRDAAMGDDEDLPEPD